MLNPFKNIFKSHSEEDDSFDFITEIKTNDTFRKNALLYGLWNLDYPEYFGLVCLDNFRSLPTLSKAQALYRMFLDQNSQFSVNLDNTHQVLADSAYSAAISQITRDHRRKNKSGPINQMTMLPPNLFKAAEDKVETNLSESYFRYSVTVDLTEARRKLLAVPRSGGYTTVPGLRDACKSLQTAGFDLKKLGIEYAVATLP